MSNLELSDSEKLAYQMITSTPDAVKQLATPDGGIGLNAMHAFMRNLVRKMELAEAKRRNTFVDVEVKRE